MVTVVAMALFFSATPADAQQNGDIYTNLARLTFAGAPEGIEARVSFTLEFTDGDDAPTDIDLDCADDAGCEVAFVLENVPGAVVGPVLVVDPDQVTGHVWSVSDARFEVVDDQLRLVAGVSLDYETEPEVPVRISVTDDGGNVYEETFDVKVFDVNETPFDLTLSSGYVPPDSPGQVIGELSVSDPDAGDEHVFTVAGDDRFVVVDGVLSLAEGVLLPPDTEVPVTVVATDRGGLKTELSAVITTVRTVVPTPSNIELLAPDATGNTYAIEPAVCQFGGDLAIASRSLDFRSPNPFGDLSVDPVDAYAIGDPVYIGVSDMDQNYNPLLVESVDVVVNVSLTNDTETVRLFESGPDSGYFVGYVITTNQVSVPEDCILNVRSRSQVNATYTDPTDGQDISTRLADIAPVGIVFDDTTGEPVNGVILTLVRVATSTPADVRGDGPVYSLYPSALKSGEDTRDRSGAVYDVDAGEYRFPAIPDGEYRLEIFNTQRYVFSQRPDSELQSLGASLERALTVTSDGAYRLSDASRGLPFRVSQGALPRIDIPVTRIGPAVPASPSPSKTEFFQYSPNPAVGTPYNVQQTVCVAGQTREVVELRNVLVPVPGVVNLIRTDVIKVGQPVFVKVTDADQNRDANVRETITVQLDVAASGDREFLELTETEPNSGEFIGYIQSAEEESSSGSCTLGVVKNQPITSTYTDAFDNTDSSESLVLVDPFGRVFSTRNGELINGATITLVNADTNEPAAVFGDGPLFAPFPSTLVTGGSVTDDAGLQYDFPDGEYRFPFVAPGNYRLEVTNLPANLVFPSVVSDLVIQGLNGAPFQVVDGSRGDVFEVPVGPALNIDVPIDEPSANVFLQKEASRDVAAIGDFIQYRITVNNENGGTAGDSAIVDRLPKGFRFQSGSLRIDGARAPDPSIDANGSLLTINLPPVGTEPVDVRYVAEITAGAGLGPAVNTASVMGDLIVSSNTATARVVVTDDLFSRKAMLTGRVTLEQCADEAGQGDPAPVTGMPGVRIFLEDGSYVITDDEGMWHMEGIEPGSHVVQLDIDSLEERYEPSPCNSNARFAGATHSQFVDLQGGTLWRADFRVREKAPPVSDIELIQSLAVDGDRVWVLVTASAEGRVVAEDASVIYRLPAGWTVIAGTEELDGSPISHSQSIVGTVWNIGDVVTSKELRFAIQPKPGQKKPPPDNLLLALQPRFETRSVALTSADRADLDRLIAKLGNRRWEAVTVVGHTDNVRIAPENRGEFADNAALSQARAQAVADYLASRGDFPAIAVVGAADRYPVASNETRAGRQQNRRVELLFNAAPDLPEDRTITASVLAGDSTARLSFTSVGTPKGKTPPNRLPLVQLAGQNVKVSTSVRSQAIGSWDLLDASGETPVASRDPDRQGLITLNEGERVSTRVMAIKLDLDSRLKPKLLVDGTEVPKDRIGFTMEDGDTGKTLYSYIGVDLGEPGEHQITVQGVDSFGNARFDETISYVRVGELFRLEVVESEGNIADGRTPVRVQLDLRDRSGEKISRPYKLVFESDSLVALDRGLSLSELAEIRDRNYIDVDADGLLQFNPVSRSGVYHASLYYGDEQDTEIELFVAPEKRDWIMVGLAEGSLAQQKLSGNMEGLADAGLDDEFSADGRVAFYAKGQIKGEYILTIAYDTAKEKKNALSQAIDPSAYYTLYGDRSTLQYDASSNEKLFLKLEKHQFSALFGDFTTGLTVNELSSYSRNFTGLKTEYEGDRFEFSAFASEANQAFVKDEIRGDGTSGLYRLSAGGILINSEKIRLETRDRFRSERILESVDMRRYVDYNIDYDAGTIFFKQPVYSQDPAFNPVFIVADYETAGDGRDRMNLGGRVAYKPNERVEVGATAIREGVENRETGLLGVDVAVEIDADTEFRAEIATTGSKLEDGSETSGTAYLAEISRRNAELDARAYVREQDGGFGLGQQNASESGTRKMGVEGAYTVRDGVEVRGEAYRQTNLGTGSTEDVVSTTMEMRNDQYSINTGLRSAVSDADGVESVSNQVLVGGSYKVLDGRANLTASADAPIGGQGEAANFPKRLRVGLDYKLNDAVTLSAEQEFSWGEELDTQGTRIGMSSRLWDGAELNTSVQQSADQENSERLAAVAGLKQRWEYNDAWSFDFGVDRSQTIKQTRAAPELEVTTVYSSPGDDDFTAVTFGSNYKRNAWDWSTRVEYRKADTGDKVNLLSDVIHDLDEGAQLLAQINIQKNDTEFSAQTTTDVRLGYAFRPIDSRWTLFNRLDLSRNTSSSLDSSVVSQKIVNNLNANYLWQENTQIAFQYGAKYVVDNFDDDEYRGFTDLLGMEIRHDMNNKWDLGVQTSMYNSYAAGASDTSFGVSVGYNMAHNVWMSLGYNFSGFHDEDFSASEYTAKGVYLKYRVKFDQFDARNLMQRIGTQ
ncbi:MAG: OmpA family protein [Pseudomonadota bacterium]